MISFEEFTSLTAEEQKSMLQNLKNEVSIKEIIEAWGISRSKLYSMQNKLGITNEPRKPRKPKDKKTKATRSPRKPRSETNPSTNTNFEFTSTDFNEELDSNINAPKFSLQLETMGPAPLLVDTIQMILLSERVAHLNLKINIQIEQV
ncbi:MAG: hypothetical protein ABRQ26_13270 [Syntrophomonadaceae bacterium]